ncbi:MAG: hypothetical protein LBN09_00735 [Clostridioides sp.]|jgi:hypothetical protein|nr:hypothetical protein [Clostridioides sp.]
MKKTKIGAVLSIIVILGASLSGCTQTKKVIDSTDIKINIDEKEGPKVAVDKDNANAIKLGKIRFDKLESKTEEDKSISEKIENNANFNVAYTKLHYSEYDKTGNVITEDATVAFDMTLKPNEKGFVEIVPNEFVDSIKIKSYEYYAQSKCINVDIATGKVSIEKRSLKIQNSKQYESLLVSATETLDTEKAKTFNVKIKNTSATGLGNIILTVAHLNDKGEYTSVDHISCGTVLKPSDETSVEVTTDKGCQSIEIVGYMYDDLKENESVDVDFKSHIAIIH